MRGVRSISEVRVALLGFGAVGRAIAERLVDEPALARRIRLVTVADSRGLAQDRDGLDPAAILARKAQTGSVGSVSVVPGLLARHAGADVVVDALPSDYRTGEPSKSAMLAALLDGKRYVCAAKSVPALHWGVARRLATRHGGSVAASASVCGGTPALELLASAFHGDRLERIEGVLNGSTTFVLTRLEEGATWDEALAEARHEGILEADPSLDFLGTDAAAKAVILANHAWDAGLTLAHARREGIVGVTREEAREARAKGLAIRLVARATPSGVSVAPVALPRDHPLVAERAECVVRLKLAGAGTVTLRGPGAGGRETASAVISDVLAPAGRPLAPLPGARR